MEIPENLTPRIKEILSRHVNDVPEIVEGETGHLTVLPKDTLLQQSPSSPKKKREFITHIEQTLPPGDRE